MPVAWLQSFNLLCLPSTSREASHTAASMTQSSWCSTLLALPLIPSLHRLLHRRGQPPSTIPLLAKGLSFAHQVGPASAALFLLFGGLLLITGYMGSHLQVLPHSMLMSILGWTYRLPPAALGHRQHFAVHRCSAGRGVSGDTSPRSCVDSARRARPEVTRAAATRRDRRVLPWPVLRACDGGCSHVARAWLRSPASH